MSDGLQSYGMTFHTHTHTHTHIDVFSKLNHDNILWSAICLMTQILYLFTPYISVHPQHGCGTYFAMLSEQYHSVEYTKIHLYSFYCTS